MASTKRNRWSVCWRKSEDTWWSNLYSMISLNNELMRLYLVSLRQSIQRLNLRGLQTAYLTLYNYYASSHIWDEKWGPSWMPSHESPFVVLRQSHFIQTQFTRITLHITYTCFSPATIHVSSLLHQIPPLHKYQTNIIYPAPFRSCQQPYKRRQDSTPIRRTYKSG